VLTYKLYFCTQVRLQNIQVKVEYQGYVVKVKVVWLKINLFVTASTAVSLAHANQCHFGYCKTLLFTSLTLASSVKTYVQSSTKP